MTRSLSVLAVTLVTGACSPPAAPIPPRVDVPPVLSVAPVETAAPRMDDAPVPWAARPIAMPERPDPPASPLPPPTRGFVTEQLVRAAATWHARFAPLDAKNERTAMDVISIDGTSREDVWMLAVDTDGNATLVRYDGNKVVERYARPCGWVGSSGSLGIRFSMVRADARQVHVLASYREPDWRVGGDLTASLDRRTKRWTCAQAGIAPIRVASHGDFTWKLEDPAMGNGVCRLHAVDGPCLPTPWWSPSYNEPSQDTTDYGVWSTALWMGGLDDGWIANGDERGSSWLFRFNGVAWSPVAVVGKGERFTDVWADDSGVAYAIVTAKNDGWILRIEGHDTRSIATPMGFDATRVRGTGPRDVWFLGPKHVYQWDGQRLHEMATNVFGDSDDVWGSPGGELWIVGGRVVSHTEAPR